MRTRLYADLVLVVSILMAVTLSACGGGGSGAPGAAPSGIASPKLQAVASLFDSEAVAHGSAASVSGYLVTFGDVQGSTTNFRCSGNAVIFSESIWDLQASFGQGVAINEMFAMGAFGQCILGRSFSTTPPHGTSHSFMYTSRAIPDYVADHAGFFAELFQP